MTWSDAARRAAAEARRRRRVMFHVTTTENAQRILSTGIQPGKPGQWFHAGSGKKYVKGKEIFAFQRRIDAYRWAAKMEWDKFQSPNMGHGRISIVKFRSPDGWKQDKADPLTQSGYQGPWLKRKEAVPASDVVGMKRLTPRMIKRLVAFSNRRKI